jgi:4'-phosphopantetheinyl transferase
MSGQTSTPTHAASVGGVAWAPAAVATELAAGAAEVWLADLNAVTDELCKLLDPEESARAARFANARHGVLWARAHGLLRLLLGGHLGTDPRLLRFTAGAHGKPALEGEQGEGVGEGVSFNLSHSAHLALLAFASGSEVGVDIELAHRPVDVLGVARRMFGAGEAQRLAGLQPPLREREFLRGWVRHEAALKYHGSGLGGPDSEPAVEQPWIAEMDVGPDAAGALALARAPGELRLWEWRDARSSPGHE